MDREALEGWLAVVDEVSYYELLGIDSSAGHDEIQRAFHGFAATFHPDVHILRAESERSAIHRIFTRGTEAYRVLSDANLRQRYDLMRAGPARPPRMTSSPSRGPSTSASTASRLEDHVRISRARPFAREAETLARKHEYAKAKLQLKLAISMDPENPALESYLEELNARIIEAKEKRS